MSARRLLACLVVVPCVLVAVLALAGSAGAIVGNPFLFKFGSFTRVQSIAVDDSSGDVYVYDMGQGGGSLFKFDAEGNAASFSGLPGEPTVIEGLGAAHGYNAETEIAVDNSAQATKGDIYVATNNHVIKIIGPDGKALGSIGEQSPAPWSTEPCGVAVDTSGNVYVGFAEGFVNKYAHKPTGVTNSDYASTLYGVGEVCNIAVDSLGNVFADTYSFGPVTRYEALQFGSLSAVGTVVDKGGTTLAVDPGNDEVYVDEREQVSYFGAHGEPFEHPINTFPIMRLAGFSFGIGVNGVSHDVYVSDGEGHIALYGPYGPEPALVEGESVTSVGYTEAVLHATVNPNEASVKYHFEWGLDTKYGSSAPVPDVPIGTGKEGVAVSQAIANLQTGTTYHYRVVATTSEGAMARGGDMTLTTYAARTTGAESCANAELRTVQSATYLPDCRAYELVSPPGAEKEGMNVSTYPTRTRSSADGNAALYVTKAPYGSASGSETAGAEYVSRRGSEGWSSYSINPHQDSLAYSVNETAMYQGFSPDLSKGVFLGLTPVVPGHPNVEHVANLYLRTDILTSPVGSYELLSDAFAPVPPAPGGEKEFESTGIAFGAASADWTHIVFESVDDLTPETAGLNTERPKAYEWHDGEVRLVGVLPKGEPAEGSVIARGVGSGGKNAEGSNSKVLTNWATNAISTDGSRVIFEGWPVTSMTKGKNAGSGSYDAQAGVLYMRIDGRETIQLNVSERKVPDVSRPAVFAAATPGDSKVFFITAEALTENATVGSGNNLYMYDIDAPEGHRLTLISVDTESNGANGEPAEGVAGLSSDGSYVYFYGGNDLLPGMPPLDKKVDNDERRLYLWHDGELRFIVTHQEKEEGGYGWGGLTGLGAGIYYGDAFRVSADGKTIAFVSADRTTAKRTGYNNYYNQPITGPCTGGNTALPFKSYCHEVYVYNVDTNKLSCASCNRTGAEALSEARTSSAADEFGLGIGTQYLNNFMSADGRYVFFDTGEALVPEDVNGESDVYEYDTVTERVSLISSGTCGCGSYFVDASPDGSNVFFTTRQRLVHVDVDEAADLYDARIGGGIPAQNRPPAAECSGEECQGPTASPPVISLPASSTFAGPGNASLLAGKAGASVKRKPVKHRRRVKHKKHRKRGRSSGRRASRSAGR